MVTSIRGHTATNNTRPAFQITVLGLPGVSLKGKTVRGGGAGMGPRHSELENRNKGSMTSKLRPTHARSRGFASHDKGKWEVVDA